MISQIRVYHYPLSRSVRVLWVLNELGISQFEIKRIKLLLGEGYSEEFLKLNPNHSVPVIQLSYNGKEYVFFESTALVRLLAGEFRNHLLINLKPKPDLIPSLKNGASLIEIGEFEQWYAFAGITLDMCLWSIRVIFDFRKKDQEKDLLETYVNKWNTELLPQIIQRFEDGRYFVLKDFGFSIVDIILGHVLSWARKYPFLNEFSPNLHKYFRGLRSRQAYKVSTEDAHLFEKDARL